MSIGTEHPARRVLHRELHARPSLYFDGEVNVWHAAIVPDIDAPSSVADLLDTEDVSFEGDEQNGTASLGTGRLKWECHSEFVSLTYAEPATPDACLNVPSSFRHLVERTSGRLVAAVVVIVREGEAPPSFGSEGDFVASKVGGGDAEVHSSFRLSVEGFVELHLFNRNLNSYRAGRMVRRLLEIETYRMMALLALPVAQDTVAALPDIDRRLASLNQHLKQAGSVEKRLLSEVTHLASDILSRSVSARQRCGATRAYADIVASRLQELREDRVEQRQRISTFIERRFQPSVRFIQTSERRLDEVTQRVTMASDLLRTAVQVQLEEQNAELLRSMEERTRVQVHIQQAVEGFSVIAISYYAVSLAKLALESLTEVGVELHAVKLLLAISIPALVACVWLAIRHARRRIATPCPTH
ncbi:DUF3422 domain-containing protein [Agrobacterium sp. SOY23]|uniref:DUF3422 domain-containing protein n=1 Tax=Agrobacterium sp. SOY23 TaxID=3014555 RepID=UPI0022B0164F|nr:DUF3422 domain-containing protein [Agrobacterium sp. SOY23]MCZ4430458.1 DUF3422 domain-containing protein [Agrobacterium sp. SOY23]